MMTTRRSFLAFLGVAPVGLPNAGLLGRESRTFVLDRFSVAGFQYHEGPSIRGDLMPGLMVRLRAEPDIPFDSRAVRIEYRNRHIGYVPRSQNTILSNLLRQDAPVTGRIVAADPLAKPWHALQVEAILTI